ncbi:MAG TPA: L-lactate permease [Anaerolineae bacterium]|nr:L-lactate permease [Anaerolineae bacterium]HQK14809.1 L-lactate permease [Anaerolineae bacterium]
MDILLAALPLVLILILMVGFRWNGAKAGAVGWLAALLIAVVRFSATTGFIFWAQVEGFFRALQVLYIIWGALFFFRITEANGSLNAMSAMLQHLSPGRTLQVLLLAWAFASFLQGVGGFGVPVAVLAPILIGIGFPPLAAVVMPSLGHGWAVSFGSLGASYEALKTATGLEGAVIAPAMAAVLGGVCFLIGVLVLWVAGGKVALRDGWWPMLTMALAMSGIQYLAVCAGLYNIAAMLGALAGLIVGVGWALGQRNGRVQPLTDFPWTRSLLAIVPYLLLLIVILSVSFTPALARWLERVTIQIPIPARTLADGRSLAAGKTKALALFGHPGALLFYSGGLTLLWSKIQGTLPPGSGKKIRAGMLRSGMQSSLGIVAMVAMATTMENVGMVTVLSRAMADVAGTLFPAIAPFIGALGAFMTGSNTNSNVLFGAFQQQVAQTLGYSVPFILAIHNAGAAVGSIFAPAKIIVGCSTVGLSCQEGEVLRRTTRYSLVILFALAVLALVITHFR